VVCGNDNSRSGVCKGVSMRICGIELKSSRALLAVVEVTDEGVNPIPMETRMIKLDDDERADLVKSFYAAFCSFVRDNQIDVVAVKKRAKSGEYAGGAVSFKMEALIQLCDEIQIMLISSQSIAATNRREEFDLPDELKKYQIPAYLTACCHASKER